MNDLQLLLDYWVITKVDGTFILNGKYEDFVESLESLMQREKIRIIDTAADQVSLLKLQVK